MSPSVGSGGLPRSDLADRSVDQQESEAERLDRNYNELLQELRVAQTGVQILFAFLLTIAFQPTFERLNEFQRHVYLATLPSAAASVIMFIAPVAIHRMTFRRGMKDHLVALTSRLAMAGLVLLSLAILGAVLLVMDVVAGRRPAVSVTACTTALIAMLWIALPTYLRFGNAPVASPGLHRERHTDD